MRGPDVLGRKSPVFGPAKPPAGWTGSEIIRNLLLDTKEAVPENYTKLVNRLKKDFNFVIDDVAFDETLDINVHAFYDENIDGTKVPFDFCSSGSGMMQILQILTSIYRYCPDSISVVLLDEPDAHLHANMQVALFYSLREIQKELGIQILISTHSTAIISAASPSEIIPISNAQHIESLTQVEEVEDVISERIDSYELSKVKSNGVLLFFEDKDIDYFLKCDQVLDQHCLVGPRTVAYLTGRTKDDKLPFGIKPVLNEMLGRDISVFVIRDRDGLSSDIVDTITGIADEAEVNYHFLSNYEMESYLLVPDLIFRTLKHLNPDKEVPSSEEIHEKIGEILINTIRLAKYKYNTVLEDNLSKLASFDGLELYRSSNEYRRKAEEIRAANELAADFNGLRKVGMGKETLKELMWWINNDKRLKISKKALIRQLDAEDIPDEIKLLFQEISHAMSRLAPVGQV
ncbi:MAG: AAA family ATPase [Peptococcaceae bacterium]|nr:AAA family ATPase [Peptococcaceae bacterium]